MLGALVDHQSYLDGAERRERARRVRAGRRLERLLGALVRERMRTLHGEEFARELAAVGQGKVDPYTAAHRLLREILGEEA